ncbi:N-acetylmuramoyl-L-alanine amidase [Clostridium sp. MSJ-4]|uniref:N-acetylmuramoyl-L-alanine amidase n=1 Tax=Clostridium simiarum TaxID=2841506 RepID=A0ABS6F1W1_9CLOT|nr:N-acetylmuramoyl-L-alanine amidase [Clostridium simiarum]MBU5592512.1 N-acetylmuramoyl-L-alanine amidase [Clostridium simiarum]
MYKLIRKISLVGVLILFLTFPQNLAVQASAETLPLKDIPIVSNTGITVKQMEDWARKNNATETFISLAKLYVELAPSHGGVNPAIAYAQSAKETGYGRFTGVLDESFNNPCGMKTSAGGGDSDPSAHQRFNSWEEGIKAHLDHLAIYAGAEGYPRKDTFDPRHFSFLMGRAKNLSDLGGNWAPSLSYGTQIIDMINIMITGSPVKKLPNKMFIDTPIQNQNYLDSSVEVSGWALNNYGIKKVSFYVNNNLVGETNTGVNRPDVDAAFPGYPSGDKSGYFFSIPASAIPQGESILKVEALGKDGTIQKEERTINSIKKTNKPSKMFIDDPKIDEVISNKDVVLSGWALMGSGVKNINVYVNGNFISSIGTGVNRPDVDAAFPGYPLGDKSGYYGVIPAKHFYSGKNTITVEVIGNDGTTQKEERNINFIMKTNKPSKMFIDDPKTNQVINNNDVVLSGWALMGSGVKNINVYVNGNFISSITTGVNRPDVDAAFPGYPLGNKSGYYGVIPAKHFYSGKNTITVEVVGNDNSVIKEDRTISFVSNNSKPTINEIVTDKISPQKVGSNIRVSVNASGSNLLYKFWIHDGNSWKIVRDYSASNTYDWKPSKEGTYRVWVDIKDKNSNNTVDHSKEIYYSIKNQVGKITSLTTDVNSPQSFGKSINIKVQSSGFINPVYRYWIKDDRGWRVIKDYSTSNSIQWTPQRSGEHGIWVDARESVSNGDVEHSLEIPYYINPQIKDITVDGVSSNTGISPAPYKGKPVNIAVNGAGENVLYRFWISDGIKWRVIRDYDYSNSTTWTPTILGKHGIWVEAKASNSPNTYDVYKSVDYEIIGGQPLSVTTSVASPQKAGNTITVKANGGRAINPLYKFWVSDGIQWTVVQDYSTSNTFNWKPTSGGSYKIWVDIKDKNSQNSADESKEIPFIIEGSSIKSKTIVIDPGHNHGGDDGAYAKFDGITYSERDLNMEVALKLKTYLESYGFNVILTRQPGEILKDDLQTSLRKRTEIANKAKADFFISLHHDSGASSASGISTHYSSYRPTLDNEGVAPGVDPGGYSYDNLLIDYTPCKEAIISRELANKLVNGLSSELGYTNRKAHDHGLAVTRNIDVPSVLLELGFITNKNEAIRCADSTEQHKKAKKIADIIFDYFK